MRQLFSLAIVSLSLANCGTGFQKQPETETTGKSDKLTYIDLFRKYFKRPTLNFITRHHKASEAYYDSDIGWYEAKPAHSETVGEVTYSKDFPRFLSNPESYLGHISKSLKEKLGNIRQKYMVSDSLGDYSTDKYFSDFLKLKSLYVKIDSHDFYTLHANLYQDVVNALANETMEYPKGDDSTLFKKDSVRVELGNILKRHFRLNVSEESEVYAELYPYSEELLEAFASQIKKNSNFLTQFENFDHFSRMLEHAKYGRVRL